MEPILEVKGIAKRFRIGHRTGGYLNLRESILSAFRFEKQQTEDFWALKDISFEVQAGESIGIIGSNGAGKSTLLKILSKITPPTKGKIISRGRIASLLEVGTGFHPELTGRENIFFNGSLLGMKRKEIETKFDEMVDFSGVEKFLDTPLKHYSSGMQLRLAFAVAAHLDIEILVIDEVLAVGDQEFQKKCLGKMEQVTSSGRTLLFVSHNLGLVKSICQKGITLSKGEVIFSGSSNQAVEFYSNLLTKQETEGPSVSYSYDKSIGIKGVTVNNLNETLHNSPINVGDKWSIKFTLEATSEFKHFIAAVGLISIDDVPIRTMFSTPQNLKAGTYSLEFVHDDVFLAFGMYKISIGLSSREQSLLYIPDCLAFEIVETSDKSVFLRSDPRSGFILNQANVITKIN